MRARDLPGLFGVVTEIDGSPILTDALAAGHRPSST